MPSYCPCPTLYAGCRFSLFGLSLDAFSDDSRCTPQTWDSRLSIVYSSIVETSLGTTRQVASVSRFDCRASLSVGVCPSIPLRVLHRLSTLLDFLLYQHGSPGKGLLIQIRWNNRLFFQIILTDHSIY